MKHNLQQDDDSDIKELFQSVRPDTTLRPGFKEELFGRMLARQRANAERTPMRQLVVRFGKPAYRIAAGLAAMFVVGVAVWLFFGNVGPVSAQFSDVLARIRQAQTVVFESECIAPDGFRDKTHVAVSYPGRVRTAMSDGKILITDMTSGRQLRLTPGENKAILRTKYIDLMYNEPLNDLRRAVDAQGKLVGSEEINGLRTEVYQVTLAGATLRVWVDPRENFPVRIESRATRADGQELLMTLSNFSWNVKVPDSLFAMTPPAGYSVSTPEADASEQSLINLLKVCAQDSDGYFPDSLNATAVLSIIARKYPSDVQIPTADTGGAPLSVSVTGKARDDYKACRFGLSFIKQIATAGSWHYTGKGVMFGDKTAVVCWWQLSGDDKCRVVYGDLTARDITVEELPPTVK